MKLTIFKGIANGLGEHLNFDINFGPLKKLQKEMDHNALELKDSFDEECVNFFKERLPKTFDFSRIKEIRIKIKKSKLMNSFMIKLIVKVDNKEFSGGGISVINKNDI